MTDHETALVLPEAGALALLEHDGKAARDYPREALALLAVAGIGVRVGRSRARACRDVVGHAGLWLRSKPEPEIP